MSLTLPSIYTFFFYSSSAPRHLHSFPTRRSSDLAPVARGLQPEQRAPARRHDPLSPRLRQSAGGDRNRDRKSTRLNSSHRCISYAVFCLKKKNRIKNDSVNIYCNVI